MSKNKKLYTKGCRKFQITVFEYVGRVSTRQLVLSWPPLSDWSPTYSCCAYLVKLQFSSP